MLRHAPMLLLGLVVFVGACAPSGRDAVTQPVNSAPGPTVAASTISTVPSPATSTSTTPSIATSTVPATGSPTRARAPAPAATAILRGAVALEPGARLTLTPGAEVVVHPAASFEVELSVQSSDARLVLVDARDDLVAASATREVGAGTKLTLAPAAPLVPGSRYALRLDGTSDRDLHDDVGRAFSAVTLPLLAAGSPPPPEPKKAARRKKRR